MGSNGQEDMGFTKHNLRDQAARLEKSLGSVTSTITNGIKAKRDGDNAEGALNNERQIAKMLIKNNRICIQPWSKINSVTMVIFSQIRICIQPWPKKNSVTTVIKKGVAF